MKINLICASKFKKNSPLLDIYNEYFKRITSFKISLFEVDDKNLSQLDTNKALFSFIKPPCFTILLDEGGKLVNSQELCSIFYKFPHQNISIINLLIGGADGFLLEYKQKADMLISLSKLTFPHQLARVILIEQLYRIQTINQGHPYHRE
jgi:23S rRNA (pseudouridine1915-N3)-methyltransferase